MADLSKNKFDIPDFLTFLFPLLNLAGSSSFPEPPDLTDIGVDKQSINKFFALRRAISRSSIQRQAAQATRTAVGNLPSSLSQSTIPASISAGIQVKAGEQIAGAEAELAGQEQNALLQLYDILDRQFRNKLAIRQAKQKEKTDVFDVLSFLPLIL